MPKPNPLPSREELRELFEYDPKTRALLKKTPYGLVPVEHTKERRGYLYVTIDGLRYGIHRIIYAMTNGTPDDPDLQIGHRSGDVRSNGHLNLTLLTQSENKSDGTKNPYVRTVDTYIEYSDICQRYIVRPRFKGKQRRCKSFKTLGEAQAARDAMIATLRQEYIDAPSLIPFED